MSQKVVVNSRITHGESSDLFLANVDGVVRVLKVLHPHLADDPIVRSRFVREAETTARISHPNVVRVYGLTEFEGLPAMIMEHVNGGSLQGRRLTPEPASRVLRGALGALDAIHGMGVIHRDIRPSHILLDADGSPKLTDFGMASVRDLSGLTRSTVFSTQPHYVDPYSWGRGRPTPAQDLYSLGAVIFECLTGAPPPLTLFSRDTGARARALGELSSSFDHFLATLVPLLLEEPERRPRSAREAMDWLEEGRLGGGRALVECLYCGASMPADAMICLSCGRQPLVVDHDPRGDFIALRKISENQEVLSPFLRKLRLLSADSAPLPRLLIGDVRLYSRAEQKSGMRLPVRIAENIAPASVPALISLLEDDESGKIQIARYPMTAAGRVKRGPLIRLKTGAVAPQATAEALRRLAARCREGDPETVESRLRKECAYAIAIAARNLGGSAGDSSEAPMPVGPEDLDDLYQAFVRAVDRLETIGRYLDGIDLAAAYTDWERATVVGAEGDAQLEKTQQVFDGYSTTEREAARLRHKIEDACRALEQADRTSLSSRLDEIKLRLEE